MNQIELNPTDLLVTPISDYFTKVREGILNTTITKDDTYSVGIIEHVGNKLDPMIIGHIIYYHKNIGIEVNLGNLGRYNLIQWETKLLVRMDQDRDNY
jgi:hypothetical protein